MRNGLRAVEQLVIEILKSLQQYRLNLQVLQFLKLFYQLEENNSDGNTSTTFSLDTLIQFQDIFKIH